MMMMMEMHAFFHPYSLSGVLYSELLTSLFLNLPQGCDEEAHLHAI